MNYLSASRVKGLAQLLKAPLSAPQLGEALWPGHRMGLVNARAIVRELLLRKLITAEGDEKVTIYKATSEASRIVENPPWLCRYCGLDVTGSRKRLRFYPCEGCEAPHQTCRLCRRHLVRPTGDFPYVVKVRACPGKFEVPKRAEKKQKEKPAAAPKPAMAQAEFQF